MQLKLSNFCISTINSVPSLYPYLHLSQVSCLLISLLTTEDSTNAGYWRSAAAYENTYPRLFSLRAASRVWGLSYGLFKNTTTFWTIGSRLWKKLLKPLFLTYLVIYLLTYLVTCLLTSLLIYLTYLPSNQLTILTYLTTYLLTYLPACCLSYLPRHLIPRNMLATKNISHV